MQQPDGNPVVLGPDELRGVRLDDPLPSPAEQLDKLIVWVGGNQPSPAESVEIPVSAVSAWIGAPIVPNNPGATIGWILEQDETRPIFEKRAPSAQLRLKLTLTGWQRYEALQRATSETRNAFMAMQFGDAELNSVVENCFRPAVRRAGFTLRILTDGQPAGLIDDQLRVALRTSRFVIADLTHGNQGSYWEAGFAEGLGRPVIYTCRKSEWDAVDASGRRKVHFDASHLVTVIWESGKLHDAADRITATIRATLPSEARMTDDP